MFDVVFLSFLYLKPALKVLLVCGPVWTVALTLQFVLQDRKQDGVLMSADSEKSKRSRASVSVHLQTHLSVC